MAIYPKLDGIFNQLMGSVIMRKLIIGLMIIGLLVGGYYLAKPDACAAGFCQQAARCISDAQCHGDNCHCAITPGIDEGFCVNN